MSLPARIGTAAWNIPGPLKNLFPDEGTHLERYAKVFNAVEINSSFYKEHKPETYAKWASQTPPDFLFSVKLARFFLQEKKLQETGILLTESVRGIQQLGEKLGVLLVQLSPSLEFQKQTAETFLNALRKIYSGGLVIEPRNISWTTEPALQLLENYSVNKVLADPEPCPLSVGKRAPLEKIRYYRLHGSPEIYKSNYSEDILERIGQKLKEPTCSAQENWVIFDNTTFGYATENARTLKNLF